MIYRRPTTFWVMLISSYWGMIVSALAEEQKGRDLSLRDNLAQKCTYIVEEQIAQQIISGASIVIGDKESVLLRESWGDASFKHHAKMGLNTIVDVASLTKVLATTTAILICKDDGLLQLDAPFVKYLPDYSGKADGITVRDLALHRSGFGGQSGYDAPTGEEIKEKLLSCSPTEAQGSFKYSCWNFHLLGMIVERVSGKSLSEFCREKIFLPLSMRDTSLGTPIECDASRLAQSCMTQEPGQISDFIAFRMYRDGFTAGNAGAFSTADDLAKFCACLCNRGVMESGELLFSNASSRELYPSPDKDGVVRSFGWFVAKEQNAIDGFSESSVFHTGWSGQTIFVDFDNGYYVVILTVRADNEYENAKKGRIQMLRAAGSCLTVQPKANKIKPPDVQQD